MLRALNDVWALFFGIALFMLGNGLQGTLLGLRASMEGFGTASPVWSCRAISSGCWPDRCSPRC